MDGRAGSIAPDARDPERTSAGTPAKSLWPSIKALIFPDTIFRPEPFEET
jgi:hypothetical protein